MRAPRRWNSIFFCVDGVEPFSFFGFLLIYHRLDDARVTFVLFLNSWIKRIAYSSVDFGVRFRLGVPYACQWLWRVGLSGRAVRCQSTPLARAWSCPVLSARRDGPGV